MPNDKELFAAKLKELQAMLGENTTEQPKVRELWSDWYEGMRTTKSKGTSDSILTSWKRLEPFIADKTIPEITNILFTNKIIPTIRKERKQDFKFANIRKWLGMFLGHCIENGLAPSGYRKPRFSNPDPETHAGKDYSLEETDRLMKHADWKMKPKLIMSLNHFMRRSEVALLSCDRLDRINRVIHLRAEDTKIRKARSFPYNQDLEDALVVLDQNYARLKIKSSWVFPSPINHSKSIGRDGFATAWESLKRDAKVKGRWHDLRHSALSRAFKVPGANQALICAMAGLNISVAQKIYLHITIEDLKAVLK